MLGNKFEIKINEKYVIIRTTDYNGFPVEVWRFDRNSLTHNEEIFIGNIISMSQTMVTEYEKRKRNRETGSDNEGDS